MVIVRGVRRVAGLPPRPPLPRGRRIRIGPRHGEPYWKERGWVADGDGDLLGWYHVGTRQFRGAVRGVELNLSSFSIQHPPEELRRHPHWVCFRPQGQGWYDLHFAEKPRDASSGILAIERMLSEVIGNEAHRTIQRMAQPLEERRRHARGADGTREGRVAVQRIVARPLEEEKRLAHQPEPYLRSIRRIPGWVRALVLVILALWLLGRLFC